VQHRAIRRDDAHHERVELDAGAQIGVGDRRDSPAGAAVVAGTLRHVERDPLSHDDRGRSSLADGAAIGRLRRVNVTPWVGRGQGVTDLPNRGGC